MPLLQRKRSKEEKTADFLRIRAQDVARSNPNGSQIEVYIREHNLSFDEAQKIRNQQFIPSNQRNKIDLTDVD